MSLNLKILYSIVVRILLLLAGVISVLTGVWIDLVLVVITFFMIYFHKITKKKIKKYLPYKLEIVNLIIIYSIIFMENSSMFEYSKLGIRFLFHLLASFVIGIVGFSLVYVINQEKNAIKLSPMFIGLFAFCFSLSIGTGWQIFRYVMDYVFNISIQNFNVSDSLGFLAVHSFGAGLVSFLGYLHLRNGNKKNVLSKLFGNLKREKDDDKKEQKLIMNLIQKGESEKVEFKETLRFNVNTKNYDKQITHAVLKSITAFLNTRGGTLLVGVRDNGEISGIENDDFKNYDKFMLYFNNVFRKHIGDEFIPFISYDIVKISKKGVFKVSCIKSNREVFLKDGHIEEFYIRTGPASVLLQGSKLIEYIQRRFR